MQTQQTQPHTMPILNVKRIPNRGVHGEYPALKNIDSGRVYVDITLGLPRFLEADKNGENRHGQFVAFNIPGAWCTFEHEPVCPLRRNVTFNLLPE